MVEYFSGIDWDRLA